MAEHKAKSTDPVTEEGVKTPSEDLEKAQVAALEAIKATQAYLQGSVPPTQFASNKIQKGGKFFVGGKFVNANNDEL